MADVFIASKLRKNIEKYPLSMLMELSTLAQREIDNYVDYVKTKKPVAYEVHMASLNERKELIDDVLARKRLKQLCADQTKGT